MRPGYQEQILYILNKHHSIVTVELGDAVTDDILQLIDSAKREGAKNELVILQDLVKPQTAMGNGYLHRYARDRIAQLEQSEESE